MKSISEYIPNEEQEEESLITAKIDSEIGKLRKRRDEHLLSYIDEEKNIKYKIQIESSIKSWYSIFIELYDEIWLIKLIYPNQYD